MIKWGKIITFLLVVVILFSVMFFTTPSILRGITLGLDLQGGFEILYQLEPEEGKKVDRNLLVQTQRVLDRRISALGVAEPSINIEGTDRIRVQLAGITDQARARTILATEANLTFRNEAGDILLDGTDLKENGAKVVFDELSRPIVSIAIKDADKFRDITSQYLGQRIGIYLDEDLQQAPTVQVVIPNGQATITGQESLEKAQELADLLNAGALPVALNEISSNSVGASLGQLALTKAIFAGYIAVALIFIFMLIFYRIPGLVAVITLVTYVYLTLLFIVLLNATLTLPGIAALILGIGMAVDANILTSERIKEELRSGKTLLSSFRAGQKRSFATILDANITSVIAAFVLFYFGSSAIKGFAVILILSIVVSMITAVAFSRFLLNLLVRSNWLGKPIYYGVKEREIGEL